MTDANPPPAAHTNLVLEHLKRIHGEIADLRRDARELKANSTMQLAMIGEMVKGMAPGDERFAALDVRIERIEHRLDLRDS